MQKFNRVLLLLFVLLGARLAQAQDTQQPGESDEDYLRRIRCPGFTACHGVCTENYDDALDSCEYLDYVGFGTFCRVRAARHFQDCSNACIIDCESSSGIF